MSLRDYFEFFNSRRLKRHDKLFLRKRSILMICGILLVIYLISLVFRRFNVTRLKKEDFTSQCIDKFVQSFHYEIESSDSSVWIPFENHPSSASLPTVVEPTSSSSSSFGTTYYPSINDISKNSFIPFVGNGKFSIAPVENLENGARFHIMGKRILDTFIPFDPIINVGEFGTHTKSAYVSRYRKGIVEKFTCSNYGGGIISIHEIFSAHRLIPVLFTQNIRISNPTNSPVILTLSRWSNKSVVSKPIGVTTKDHREYSMIVAPVQHSIENHSGKKQSNRLSKAQAIAIAYPSLHDTIEVHPNDRFSLSVHTFINYTGVFSHESEMQAAIPDLKISLRETVKKLVDFSDTALQQYHEHAWEKIWSSGFSISHSHAPNVVNGYQINATLYYMLSQRPMLLPNQSNQQSNSILENFSNELTNLETINRSLIYRPDRCYNGHSTLHAPRLWDRLDSVNDLYRVISLWFLTLEKQSCEHLMKSSAGNVLQAFVLSLIGLRFTPRHIEFHSHPNDLQRSFLIRRLMYDDKTLLNISVIINDENKALIRVSIENHNKLKEYYACDAGCLDAPIHLTSIVQEFPVKLTEPLTPLLYITSDREHVQELKHSIHVKEISEAPPHEHQTIALHRYGHSLGGLPNFFWIAMIFLIIIFHLFLGKLIYNEYFNSHNLPPYERTSYRNIGRYSM